MGDLSAAGVSSGLVTETSTNLADFTHLGDVIEVSWVNTNAVFIDTEDPDRQVALFNLWQRKKLLCAMVATDGYPVDAFLNGVTTQWDELGTNATPAGAMINLAASTATTSAPINQIISSVSTLGLNCDHTPGTDAFGARATVIQSRFAVTNLTTNTTCTVDIYAADRTEEFHEGLGLYWEEWTSTLPSPVRGGRSQRSQAIRGATVMAAGWWVGVNTPQQYQGHQEWVTSKASTRRSYSEDLKREL